MEQGYEVRFLKIRRQFGNHLGVWGPWSMCLENLPNESSATQPCIARLCWNLVGWCIMGWDWNRERLAGDGLKWQCSCHCHLFSYTLHIYKHSVREIRTWTLVTTGGTSIHRGEEVTTNYSGRRATVAVGSWLKWRERTGEKRQPKNNSTKTSCARSRRIGIWAEWQEEWTEILFPPRSEATTENGWRKIML